MAKGTKPKQNDEIRRFSMHHNAQGHYDAYKILISEGNRLHANSMQRAEKFKKETGEVNSRITVTDRHPLNL